MSHMSSILAQQPELMEVDLDAIRAQLPPSDHWTADSWQWQLDSEVQSAVFGIWAIFDTVDYLGWVEHTGDWDWWITTTTTDGVVHHADCGSDFHGMIDASGKLWDDPRNAAYKANWHVRDDEPRMTVLAVNAYVWHGANDDPNSLDGDYKEVEWRFDIDKISSIKIGYDT